MAALAATNITEPEKVALLANLTRMGEAVTAEQDTLDLDIEFHTLVMTATNNRPLQLAFNANMEALYTAFARVLPAIDTWQTKRVLDAHQHIANAVVSGDAEVARLWMTRHLEDVRRGCERAGLDMEQPFTPGWQGPALAGGQPAR
jgi:DNA-binding FadR family transcriptional regulator